MHVRHPFRARAPIAVLILSLASCAHTGPTPEATRQEALADLQATIREEVDDPQRSRRLSELARQADLQVSALQQLREDYQERFRELNANYNAPREQFDALDQEYHERHAAPRRALMTTILSMRSLAAPAEWTELASQIITLTPPPSTVMTPFGEGIYGEQSRRSLDELENRLKFVAMSEVQRYRLEEWAEDLGRTNKKSNDTLEDSAQEFAKLLERQNTPPESFEGLFERSDQKNATLAAEAVDRRFALRNELDEEQWHEVFGTPEKPQPMVQR